MTFFIPNAKLDLILFSFLIMDIYRTTVLNYIQLVEELQGKRFELLIHLILIL